MYCSACGQHFAQAPPVQCPSCGLQHWDQVLVCTDALVMHAGRLALVRHHQAPWTGAWDIPGGFCAAGEHPLETIRRTVPVELGLPVRVTGYLGAWPGRFPRSAQHPALGTVATMTLCYHAVPLDAAKPWPLPAGAAVAWFPPTDLPAALAYPDYLGPVLQAWRESVRRA